MNTKKLNVGVIGLGNMGRHHVRVYSELTDQCHLVSVLDFNEEKANEFATKFNCSAHTTLDTFLNSGLDAISICSPTSTHFEVAKAAISKGLHVLIEKPIAETIEQANALIKLAQEHNVHIMVGHIERFNPAISHLKNIIQEGKLGNILSITTTRAGQFPPQMKDANVVIDLAVHDIDIICYLMDASPTDLLGNAGNGLINFRADHAEIFLKFPQNRSGIVKVNWITPRRIRTLSLTGSKGYCELDFIDQTLTFQASTFTKHNEGTVEEVCQFTESAVEPLEVIKGEPLKLELSHFIDSVSRNQSPSVSGEVGKKALDIALKVR